MKNRMVFICMLLMQFLAGMAFYAWGRETYLTSPGSSMLAFFTGILYLFTSFFGLAKWEMDEN